MLVGVGERTELVIDVVRILPVTLPLQALIGFENDRRTVHLEQRIRVTLVEVELLAGHTVVYLQVGLSDAVQRVGLASARPLLVLNPRSQLKKLMEQRRPVYERLADITVVTDGREPGELADEIIKGLPA